MKKDDVLETLSEMKKDWHKKGLEKVGLFGSVAREEDGPFSDIDLAIRLQSSYLDHHDVWDYFRLLDEIKAFLSNKFHRKIDIYDLSSPGPATRKIEEEIIYV